MKQLRWSSKSSVRRSRRGSPRYARQSSDRAPEERGASAVEYGLLIAVVGVAFLAALILMDMFGAVFEAGACDTDRGYTCTPT